jgi:hypothetical protein
MEITKQKLNEIYDIMFPKSLEKDEDIKSNDMKDMLTNKESLIIMASECHKLTKWMQLNGYWD